MENKNQVLPTTILLQKLEFLKYLQNLTSNYMNSKYLPIKVGQDKLFFQKS